MICSEFCLVKSFAYLSFAAFFFFVFLLFFFCFVYFHFYFCFVCLPLTSYPYPSFYNKANKTKFFTFKFNLTMVDAEKVIGLLSKTEGKEADINYDKPLTAVETLCYLPFV